MQSLLVLLLPTVISAIGPMDNNWHVTIDGLKDANDCVRVNSITFDTSNNHQFSCDGTCQAGVAAECSGSFSGCQGTYDPSTVTKPDSIEGCTIEGEPSAVTLTGYLVDVLCYNNFIVEQADSNGGAGWAPDKIHLRTSMPFHTRGCLIVNYCAMTGYNLLTLNAETQEYELLAKIESGENGGGKVFDWLVTADRSAGASVGAAAGASGDGAGDGSNTDDDNACSAGQATCVADPACKAVFDPVTVAANSGPVIAPDIRSACAANCLCNPVLTCYEQAQAAEQAAKAETCLADSTTVCRRRSDSKATTHAMCRRRNHNSETEPNGMCCGGEGDDETNDMISGGTCVQFTPAAQLPACTSGASAATPAPTSAPTVIVNMVVANVDYAVLSADSELQTAFETGIKEAVAAQATTAGTEITPAMVAVTISAASSSRRLSNQTAGGVAVEATITPPAGVDASTLSSALDTATAKEALGTKVATKVAAVPGIDAAKVDASAEFTPAISAIAVSTDAPTAAPTAAPGAESSHGSLTVTSPMKLLAPLLFAVGLM